MYEKKSDFGRCPICDAIVSLDPDYNVKCDSCSYERYVPPENSGWKVIYINKDEEKE